MLQSPHHPRSPKEVGLRQQRKRAERGAKKMISAAAFCAATPVSCSCSLEILFMPQGVLESLKLTQF